MKTQNIAKIRHQVRQIYENNEDTYEFRQVKDLLIETKSHFPHTK